MDVEDFAEFVSIGGVGATLTPWGRRRLLKLSFKMAGKKMKKSPKVPDFGAWLGNVQQQEDRKEALANDRRRAAGGM